MAGRRRCARASRTRPTCAQRQEAKMEDGGWRISKNSSGRQSSLEVFAKISSAFDHSVEHCAHALPAGIQLSVLFQVYIAAIKCLIQPRLGFHRFARRFVNLVDKSCVI